jgi:hypothetical protein
MTDEPSRAADDDLDRQLARTVRHSRRYVWAVIAVLALMVVGLAVTVIVLVIVVNGNTTRNAQQINASRQVQDRRWCATLNLLTATPVTPPPNPAASPSREASYQLYADFLALRQQFGCKR